MTNNQLARQCLSILDHSRPFDNSRIELIEEHLNAATAERDAVIKDLVYALEQMRNQFIDRKNTGHDRIIYDIGHKALAKAKGEA